MGEKKIRILLVDDEMLALEYLQNLVDWDNNDYEIVGKASGGRQAVRMVEEKNPQVIISDIRMAGMDGIQLAKEMRMRHPEIAILLISAYQDFEYARKGIEAGVADYLLKHELSSTYILEKLSKIREKLKENKKQEQIYRKHFLQKLIQNEDAKEDIRDLELGKRFVMMMVKKGDYYNGKRIRSASWTKEERKVLSDAITGEQGALSYLTDTNLTEGILLVLYKIEKEPSLERIQCAIRDKAESINSALSEQKGLEYFIMTSQEVESEGLSEKFRSMSSAVRESAFWKMDRVYYLSFSKDDLEKWRVQNKAEQSKVVSSGDSISFADKMASIRMSLDSGTEVGQVIETLFEETIYSPDPADALKYLVTNLTNLQQALMDKEGIFLKAEADEETYFSLFMRVKTLMVTQFENLGNELRKRRDIGYSAQVNEMLKYITKHYSEDISLESLGNVMNMNGAYCGSLLKQETGSTFLKHLTNVRIEEAKSLLTEGKYNISEIADLVGYGSAQYFSSSFQKTTGVRPMEYRKGIVYVGK